MFFVALPSCQAGFGVLAIPTRGQQTLDVMLLALSLVISDLIRRYTRGALMEGDLTIDIVPRRLRALRHLRPIHYQAERRDMNM